MAQPKPASFYLAVQQSLESEGFKDRTIIRTFAPVEADEATEVLLVHRNEAETCWVEPSGVLIHGPIPGFGEGCTNRT